jgi:hypothetical protein
VAEAHLLKSDIAWCADNFTGSYYGLDLFDSLDRSSKGRFWLASQDAERRVHWPVQGTGFDAVNWGPATVEEFMNWHRQLGIPVVLALSKPDLYDDQHAWLSLIESRGIKPVKRLDGFELYVLH